MSEGFLYMDSAKVKYVPIVSVQNKAPMHILQGKTESTSRDYIAGRLKILNIILYFKIFFCISIQIIIFALTDKADMRIIARNKIIEYYTRHPDAETALEDWYQKVKKAEWTCFADMKQIFGSVDSVGNQHYVFNIRGNNHRLIVVVKFTIKLVLVRFIGTHAEYDLIDAKNI